MSVNDRSRNAMQRHDRQMLSTQEVRHFQRELRATIFCDGNLRLGTVTARRPSRARLEARMRVSRPEAMVDFIRSAPFQSLMRSVVIEPLAVGQQTQPAFVSGPLQISAEDCKLCLNTERAYHKETTRKIGPIPQPFLLVGGYAPSSPASQAAGRGSDPRHPLFPRPLNSPSQPSQSVQFSPIWRI